MADYFVRSGATGTADGSSWANAYTTLGAAFTARLAGDRFWIADDHFETQASALTITAKGTTAAPNYVYCVDHTVASPGVADLRSDPYNTNFAALTCAKIQTTGASNITLTGCCYCYGVVFSAGSGAVTSIIQFNDTWILENCSLRKAATTFSNTAIYFNVNGAILINTTISLGNLTDKIQWASGLTWKNTRQGTAFIGSIIPTTGPFQATGGGVNGPLILSGLDLSNLQTTLFSSFGGPATILVENCLLHSSMNTLVTTMSARWINVYLTDCDFTGTNYRQMQTTTFGALTTNTTVARTGGNSDDLGTLVSWQIVTNANTKWLLPFVTLPMVINNTRIGSDVVVRVYGIAVTAAIPATDDVWIDVLYHGSATSPLASMKSSGRATPLTTGTALSADTSAWDTQATLRPTTATALTLGAAIKVASNPGRVFFVATAGTTTSSAEPAGYASAVDGSSVTDGTAVLRAGYRFSMSVTLTSPTPQTEAALKITASVARASTTFYIDPRPVLS